MNKKIIITEQQEKFLLERLSVEPYFKSIDDISITIKNELDSFKDNIGTWNTEEDDETGNVAYFKNIGILNGVNIVLIRNSHEYSSRGAYNSDNNEIWIICRGYESLAQIKSTLSHEFTHYLDNKRGRLSSLDFNAYEMSWDDDLPRCFEWIFYCLWNETEFNAHRTIALNGEYAVNKYLRELWECICECKEYQYNDEVWNVIKNYINKNVSNIRKYFFKHTIWLYKKFSIKIKKELYLYSINNGALN